MDDLTSVSLLLSFLPSPSPVHVYLMTYGEKRGTYSKVKFIGKDRWSKSVK